MNNNEKVIYEYVNALSNLLFWNVIFFIVTAIWIYYHMNDILALDIDDINSLFSYVLENKISLFILALYIYSIYQILTKKFPTFLISPEFKIYANEESFYDKILLAVKELLTNTFVLFLILLPVYYYFNVEFGFYKALLYLSLLFFTIKIVGDSIKRTLELHNKVFHSYKLSVILYDFFKDKTKTNSRKSSINIFNNKASNDEQKIVISIILSNYFVKSFLIVFINVLLMLLIVRFFVIAITLLIAISLLLGILASYIMLKLGIKKIEIEQLKFLYKKFIYGLIKITRVSTIIAMLLSILYILYIPLPLPFIIRTILAILVWWIGINIVAANNLILVTPKPIEYLRTIDGREYRELLFLEDRHEYIFVLDKENSIIRFYKNNIVEIK